MQGLQRTLNSTNEPGLNGEAHNQIAHVNRTDALPVSSQADNPMGAGSVQSSIHESRKDLPWWTSVNKNIPNIIATVHGHDHGNEWCARDPKSQVALCFNKHTGYGGYSKNGWGHGVSFHVSRFGLFPFVPLFRLSGDGPVLAWSGAEGIV